jgi:hypothetical protein
MADGEITMLDWGGPDEEAIPPSRSRRRARPLEDVQIAEAGKARPYVYKGVRGGMLLAGYIK